MSSGRSRGAFRRVAAILLAAASIAALSSCASKPKAPAPAAASVPAASEKAQAPAPAASAPAPAASAPQAPASSADLPITIAIIPPAAAKPEAGTALRTADPAALARIREEREAIESSIAFGSPSSLARARELAAKAVALKAEDAAALDALALGVAALVYPSHADSPQAAGAVNGSLPGTAQGLLKALGEARTGRFPEVPAEAAATSLGELIPALALFSADSSDSARRAFDALERFARLGVPSILPSLLRGVDAERRRDWQGALGLYRSALAIAPDAWSASIGSARCLLSLKRSSDALAILSGLAKERSGLLAFDRPYALALYAEGRYSEAEPYVARALTQDPQDSQLVIIRARFLIRAKSYQQALPLLDAYGTVDPSSRLYLLLRSLESEGLRSRDEALKWARRGLSAYPDDPELLVAAARVLFSGPAFGREEARTLAARACELVPPGLAAPPDSDTETGAVILASHNAACAEAARLLAVDAASRYKWADAAAYLARAGALFEDKAVASLILRKSGKAAAALDYASAWRRAEPRSDAATEAWLRALVDSGDAKASQEAIARALPGTSAPALRSVMYFLQSRLQKSDEAALSLLHSALIENADNSEALAGMSDILVRRKDYAKARFYLKQALAISPGDPELEARQKQLDELSPQ